MNHYDVIIIGAGVVGCSIACSLSREGLKTLNVDTLPAPGYGSTSHSSAIIRPFYSHVTACALAHEARHRWQQWQDYLAAPDAEDLADYTETGGVVLVKSGREQDYAANLAALDEVGVDYTLYSATDLQALYPDMVLASFGPPKTLQDPEFGLVQPGKISSGIYIPACGHVNDPQLAATNLYNAARRYGAAFRFGTRVIDKIMRADQLAGIVTDTGEKLSAPMVVNAAGPHSAKVNTFMGVHDHLAITTRALRHEVAYVPATNPDSTNEGFLVDLDSGFYQRRDGNDRLIGTTDPQCDPDHEVDPDDYDAGFTAQWTLQVYRAAQRFPQTAIESKARGTVGLYDASDDWIPIYDKTSLPGYYLAIGTSGNQFKNAPMIGDLMTTLIMAGRAGIDHDQTPRRLHLHHVERDIELSFYSRNRIPQQTHSVLA
jgi:glycine/D-amino acid oxidase-like deaminating enzyme